MEERCCGKCKEKKCITLFNFKNKKKNIRRGVCKCCRNKQQAKWRAKNKESVKNYNLQKIKKKISLNKFVMDFPEKC